MMESSTPELFGSIGRVRRITDDDGITRYVIEFPKSVHMVPDYDNRGGGIGISGIVPTKLVVTEWDQLQIPLLIGTPTNV